ncbi:MAG: FlgO family outer membrane protein [Bryobacteraceae bacterium]
MHWLILKRLGCAAWLLSIPFKLPGQDAEIRAVAAGVTEALHKESKKTVAVVDFTDLQGNVTELGRYLAEDLSVALAGSGSGIEVVDRTHLKVLIQENKLAASGIIDPATAMKLGRIAGVEILITGSTTPFGDRVKFSIKALDTKTARIVSAATAEIARTRAVEELLARGVTSPSGTEPSGENAVSASQGGSQTVETHQFKFVVSSCRLDGGSRAEAQRPVGIRRDFEPAFQPPQGQAHSRGSHVTCRLTVINEGDDRDLAFYAQWNSPPSSRLIDQNGFETVAEQVQVGGKSSGGHVSGTLVAGVPTVVVLGFDGVSANVSSIALLEVSCSGADPKRGYGAFKAQFRAIPIVR